MFFRSWKSLLLSKILIIIGCAFLFFGFTYRDAAKREASTVGQITSVHCGRGCTYSYVFIVDGIKILDDSQTCHTPLTPQGCVRGALVRVYYDRTHLSENMLEEFGAASRENLVPGVGLVLFGIFLIALYFMIKRAEGSSSDSPDPDRDLDNSRPDVIHVVPGE